MNKLFELHPHFTDSDSLPRYSIEGFVGENYDWRPLDQTFTDLMRCQYNYFGNICEYLKSLGYDPDDLIFQHDINDAFHKELVASNHERIAWTEMDEANTKMLFRSVNRDEMIRILQSLRNMTNTHDIENVLEAVITEAGEAYATKREPNFPSALTDENLENIRKSRELRIVDLVQTTDFCPSQWDAKTEDGQSLYIRYRNGNLTVENVDQDDWVLIFQKSVGGIWDGEMTTEEMLEHTGLQWRR